MFSKIIKNYRDRKKEKQREEGFKWALWAFFYEGLSIDEINSIIGLSSDAFDRGALSALIAIELFIKKVSHD